MSASKNAGPRGFSRAAGFSPRGVTRTMTSQVNDLPQPSKP